MTTVTSDPVADMLTRIRNSVAVNKSTVSVPRSKLKEAILKLLKKKGFVVDFKASKQTPRTLEVILRNEHDNSPISSLRRVSKPGRRVYVKSNDIPRIMRGHGLVIVSTSEGIISGADARKRGIGGEIICEVW